MIKVKILYKLFVKCFGRRCKDYYPWCAVQKHENIWYIKMIYKWWFRN